MRRSALDSSVRKDSERSADWREIRKSGSYDKFERVFGFRLSDLSSTDRFFKLMTRPMDPACLGVMRYVFGLLMLLDGLQERGMSRIAQWDDPERCFFPLFDFLRLLPVEWIAVVYICMVLGAFGIMVGFLFRLSCLMFILPYWYIFLMEKTRWNNHSYLFGLTGIMLSLTDANRYWSIDGLIWRRKRHAHVPLWNYTLLRTQFFMVYFLAGLKKVDVDWVTGYSLRKISHYWVFLPFEYFLTSEQIDLYIVHAGGLIFDLTIAYLLFFDFTRPVAMLFCGGFHFMNSQIFSIGMFPWTMIATMPLFCYTDWPRRIISKLPRIISKLFLPSSLPLQSNPHCVYPKESVKPEENTNQSYDTPAVKGPTQPSRYHKTMVVMVLTYLSWQLFMPYSHFITKGYNSWTQGLYGYSWDMMVHTWSQQHIKITYVDKDTGEVGYLNPGIGTVRGRWSSQPDMMKQYSRCLAGKLKQQFNITNPALYFDVWRSINKRFQQRMWDPRVDILAAPWDPFTHTPWLLPVLSELTDWRTELKRIGKEIEEKWSDHSVVFIADFKGLKLDMYVQEEFTNSTIKVLRGSVNVELWQKRNHTLAVGESLKLPNGTYHTFYTVSDQSSCYMLIYTNNTRLRLNEQADHYEKIINETTSIGNVTDDELDALLSEISNTTEREKVKEVLNFRKLLFLGSVNEVTVPLTFKVLATVLSFIHTKYIVVSKSFVFAYAGVESILTGTPFRNLLPDYIVQEYKWMGGE